MKNSVHIMIVINNCHILTTNSDRHNFNERNKKPCIQIRQIVIFGITIFNKLQYKELLKADKIKFK